MDQDQTFRIAIVIAALTVLPIAAYHRIKSQANGEKLDRRQEGLFILFTLRPVGVSHMLGLIVYMVSPQWMAWSSVTLPDRLRWIGVGVGVVAGPLLVWTLHSLGKNLTDTVVTRREHTLVASGPYRWVRHPFYDCVALWMLAITLIAANWFFLLTGGLIFVLLIVRTRTEENKLIERFGDSYRLYMEQTGRFLPRIAAKRRQ